jgi:hypothetical protein
MNQEIETNVRRWAEEHHLERTHLERWLALDAASAAALWDFASRLRMRVGQVRTALEMLDEMALVEQQPISEILARAPLKRILEGSGSAPARARAFVEELRAMRFPRLGRALERLKGEIAALRMPRMVNVALPGDLGSDELRIEMRVRDAAEFRESLRIVAERADGIERILELLGGGDPDEEPSTTSRR